MGHFLDAVQFHFHVPRCWHRPSVCRSVEGIEGRKRGRAAAFMDICAIYDEAVRRTLFHHDDDRRRGEPARVCVTCPSRSKIPPSVGRGCDRSVEECLSETILASSVFRSKGHFLRERKDEGRKEGRKEGSDEGGEEKGAIGPL